jgi:hypothetical protein
MTSVAHLLQAKGHAVWSIPPDASVYEAITLNSSNTLWAAEALPGSDVE